MEHGMVHLYWGDGKGKTSAAMGLALRALGHGRKVCVLQFAKDGRSGEIQGLEALGAKVYAGKPDAAFASFMDEGRLREVRERQDRLLEEVHASDCSVLVLDEAGAALSLGIVDEALLKRAVLERPMEREVILTAHTPPEWMAEAADYCTHFVKEKHPFDRGTAAREGIEY